MNVSVIIPSYNRFEYLLNAIKSVQKQTHKSIEIIVINDCSTQKEYYTHDFKDVKTIHLKQNSKHIFGFPCAGYVRTTGMKEASGEYVAFLDDDDVWFPDKLERQMKTMKRTGCEMSCTDGLIGTGEFDPGLTYPRYNAEFFFDHIKGVYENKRSNLFNEGFPKIWDKKFLKIHNSCITSSVIINRLILKKIDYMRNLINGQEDYDCWKRILMHTNCAYVQKPCLYYNGINYENN